MECLTLLSHAIDVFSYDTLQSQTSLQSLVLWSLVEWLLQLLVGFSLYTILCHSVNQKEALYGLAVVAYRIN